MIERLPPAAAHAALPPVVVVARDASRRQVLIEVATFAGLDVVGAYPAWPQGDAGDAVALVDGDAAGDLAGQAAVIVGGEAPSPVAAAVARAYLARSAPPEQFAAAVLAVHAGLSVVAAAAAPATDAVLTEDLTPREHEVLEFLAGGLSNRAIATEMGISDNTVKFHVSSILAKLEAQSRAEAVMTAVRRGLLPL